MDKKLDNYFNKIIWKNTNWDKVAKYVSNLRFRIYKASVQNSYFKIRYLQSRLITSPFAKMLAVKVIIDSRKDIKAHLLLNFIRGYFRPFHVGYIVNYMIVEQQLDLSLFLCLKNMNCNYYDFIIYQAKQLLILWSIGAQWQAAFTANMNYLCHFHYIFYDIYIINVLIQLKSRCNLFAMLLDIKPLFYNLSPYYIVSKLDTIDSIRICVLKWLNQGKLIEFLKSNSSDNSFFLASLIILVVLAIVCYENQFALLNSNLMLSTKKINRDQLIIFNIKNYLFVCSNDYNYLNLWRQQCLLYLMIHGNTKKTINYKQVFHLNQGVFMKSYFISTTLDHLIIKPSLYAQFILMKKVSLVIHQFKNRSTFILIIMLNKLLIEWSNDFIYTNKKKFFVY